MNRDLPVIALALLRAAEGCRLSAYLDGGGQWTIGWGHTGPEISPGVTWTQAHCDDALAHDASATAAELDHLIGDGVTLTANQFGALVVFAYNIGVHAFAGSTACARVRHNELTNVPATMRLWTKIRDPHTRRLVPSMGLMHRREAEIALWHTADEAPAPTL